MHVYAYTIWEIFMVLGKMLYKSPRSYGQIQSLKKQKYLPILTWTISKIKVRMRMWQRWAVFFLEHLSIDPEHGSTRDVSPSPCVELSKFLLYIFTKQNLLYIISWFYKVDALNLPFKKKVNALDAITYAHDVDMPMNEMPISLL